MITCTSATVSGNVAADGGAEVTERGVYWGTSSNPETSGEKLQIGSGVGIFSENLDGLTSGTKYYVKAYAKNQAGTSYGTETFFTTQIIAPVVTTSAVSELTPTSAKVGGNVTDDGGHAVTQRGIYWGTHQNPRLTGTKVTIGEGKGEFSQTLTGLSKTITYYVVAFATNIKGTSYGEDISFTTQPEVASLRTTPAINITAHSARIGGEISSNGGSDVTERGVYWGTTPDVQNTGTKLAIGTGTGDFADTIENLTPATTYYVKAFATNAAGTAYGTEVNFTTLGKAPEAETLSPEEISTSSVTLYGIVSANDLNTVVTFEYGTSSSYGTSVAIPDNPITKNNDTVMVAITGLSPLTTYHYRVVAVNALGITYGADSSFTTVVTGLSAGTITDADGNSYATIGIGRQYWMTRNLRTTRYNDGVLIQKADKDSLWVNTSSGIFCWFNNDSSYYADRYGALYNWASVSTGKLCPSGWHVPTANEIQKLIDFLNDNGDAGSLLKETGTTYWNDPNTGASNKYGFNARGAGKRLDNGLFDYLNVEGNFWGSSNYSTYNASYFYLLYNQINAFPANGNKKYGMSVRCVKN